MKSIKYCRYIHSSPKMKQADFLFFFCNFSDFFSLMLRFVIFLSRGSRILQIHNLIAFRFFESGFLSFLFFGTDGHTIWTAITSGLVETVIGFIPAHKRGTGRGTVKDFSPTSTLSCFIYHRGIRESIFAAFFFARSNQK